jgi:hypothetical protein
MSYYPILSAPGCTGFTTLCNFAPNNWEVRGIQKQFINLTWTDSLRWHSIAIGELDRGEMLTFTRSDIDIYVPSEAIPLLSLGLKPLPSICDKLPILPNITYLPAWRSTLGLRSAISSTSYQGELDPFPSSGSLLSFSPFIQYGDSVENYLLLLNIEENPHSRNSLLEIFDAAVPSKIKKSIVIKNNDLSIIRLDELYFGFNDLPVIICKSMTGIPLYFSKTSDGSFLSLEHSHPPASHAIHGNRWNSQRKIKSNWFSRLGGI